MNTLAIMNEIEDACKREFAPFVERLRDRGTSGLSRLEPELLEQVLHFGATIMSKALQAMTEIEAESTTCPHCGARALSQGHRDREAKTLLGPIHFERRVFQCRPCHVLFAPMDRSLGIESGCDFTGHSKSEMALLAAHMDFDAASGILGRLTGLDASDGGIRIVAEQIGSRVADERETLPPAQSAASRLVDRSAPAGRTLVLQADGVMGRFTDDWHEAMVGVVAEIIGHKKDGRPILRVLEVVTIPRDRTTFWQVFNAAAKRQGLEAAKHVLFVGDAGGGNFDLASELDATMEQVLDFYHASQHLYAALEAGYADCGKAEIDKRHETLKERLKQKGGADAVIRRLAKLATRSVLSAAAQDTLRREIEYFRKNCHRMHYFSLRERGFPVASGLIEGLCRSVFQERFKESGMIWSTPGMRAIAALRDAALSKRWQQAVAPRLAA